MQASTELEYRTSLLENSGCFDQRGVPDIIAGKAGGPPLGLCYLTGERKLVNTPPFPKGGYLLGFAHMNSASVWLICSEPDHPSVLRLVHIF